MPAVRQRHLSACGQPSTAGCSPPQPPSPAAPRGAATHCTRRRYSCGVLGGTLGSKSSGRSQSPTGSSRGISSSTADSMAAAARAPLRSAPPQRPLSREPRLGALREAERRRGLGLTGAGGMGPGPAVRSRPEPLASRGCSLRRPRLARPQQRTEGVQPQSTVENISASSLPVKSSCATS